jgi:hypothetical protein
LAGALVLGLTACNTSALESRATVAPLPVAAATPTGPAFAGPVLGPDGRCTGTPSGTATGIGPGIEECELVRLKGKPPTDVLVGESGKGQREVQVLYSEPGGRELYFFVDNKLDRVLR